MASPARSGKPGPERQARRPRGGKPDESGWQAWPGVPSPDSWLSSGDGKAGKEVVCGALPALEPGRGIDRARRGQSGTRADLECRRVHSAWSGINLRRGRPRRRFARSRAPNGIRVESGAGGVESTLASGPGRRRTHCVSQDVASLQGAGAPPARGGCDGEGWPGGAFRVDGARGTLTRPAVSCRYQVLLEKLGLTHSSLGKQDAGGREPDVEDLKIFRGQSGPWEVPRVWWGLQSTHGHPEVFSSTGSIILGNTFQYPIEAIGSGNHSMMIVALNRLSV